MWIIVVSLLMSCGILLAETVMDVKKRKVHVSGAVVIAVCGILQVLYQQGNTAGGVLPDGILCSDFKDMLCGALIGVFFLAISLLTEEKLGRGDSLYLIALGMLLGFRKMILLSTLALLLSAVFGILLLVSRKGTRKTQLPFLPFLASSFLLIWII